MSQDLDSVVNWLGEKFGSRLRVATPLGLGKPNLLLNRLYERAKQDSSFELTLYTALSLNPPAQSSKSAPDFASRFMGPFRERHWGPGYPALRYAEEAERGKMPPNVRVHEFYFRAGAALKSKALQRDYQCMNYTHVADALTDIGIDAVVQLIAERKEGGKTRYSLACNPDITLDLVEKFKRASKPLVMVGVVHPDLPFVGGDAEVPAEFFTQIVSGQESPHRLFALPKLPVDSVDHAIGFHASQLVADDGTLQIGIGSLSDAVVSALLLRQNKNTDYGMLVRQAWGDRKPTPRIEPQTGPFTVGLYGLSELVTDGFMHLRRAGILKREVRDERTGLSTYLHGAFYLGSHEFYEWLRGLKGQDFDGLRMTRVSKVNDLYDENELLLRRQRKHPRFLNTCMQVTLLGAAASETLQDGRVVSGVGGQYNFVAMSHELKDSRSILMLRSTRGSGQKRESCIIGSHGHATIPRHLRDVVVTEYGAADLRGRTDEETIMALIEIADSEFQPKLIAHAQSHGKLRTDYTVPGWAAQNTPDRVERFVAEGRKIGFFKPFPFGSDFTPVEERLALALGALKEKSEGPRLELLRWLLKSPSVKSGTYREELVRMGMLDVSGPKGWFERRLLLAALAELRPF